VGHGSGITVDWSLWAFVVEQRPDERQDRRVGDELDEERIVLDQVVDPDVAAAGVEVVDAGGHAARLGRLGGGDQRGAGPGGPGRVEHVGHDDPAVLLEPVAQGGVVLVGGAHF
jgi:hypothetical protein